MTLQKAAIGVFIMLSMGIGLGAQSSPQAAWQPATNGTRVSPQTLRALGLDPDATANATQTSIDISKAFAAGQLRLTSSLPAPAGPGLPLVMSGKAPFSAGVLTSLSPSGDGVMLGDWDGREDLVADHSGLVWNASSALYNNWFMTRTAVSEHTIANGFNENVSYFGDSFGNVFVLWNSSLTMNPAAVGGIVINLPTSLNAFGSLNSDSRIVVTGLAVNPVADLTSWPNVNGAFTAFNQKVGEVLYVAFWDTGGGLRLMSDGTVAHSGILAFPIADTASPATAPPGVLTNIGDPVTVGGAFGVVFSEFDNVAGVAVDDDGSVYFQNADLVNMTAGNIAKVTDTGTNYDRSLAVSGILSITTLDPVGGVYGSASGPPSQVNRVTNYSGTSPVFGNIVSLAAGPHNVLYAAVAASYIPSTPSDQQGPFITSPTLPSMIISFADTSGALDSCWNGGAGLIPHGDGFADVVKKGTTLVAGVNNFRAFVHGNGPERRTSTGVPALVFGNTSNTLKLVMQIDYSIFSGLAVDEEGKVYVVSGGTPAGVGLNPSPRIGEILVFPDQSPGDRRADYVDLRANAIPRPPINSNVPDGDSDRFDHIFWVAPLDQVTMAPGGVAGLSRGFLLYLNRTRTNLAAFPTLPNGRAQYDDESSGPVSFSSFDTSEQVAGGDDARLPLKGDDASSGFEFSLGLMSGGFCPAPETAFYLNSNGNLTFGSGDVSLLPSATQFAISWPRVAPAWGDLKPDARSIAWNVGPPAQPTFGANTFPLQALGFSSPNAFTVRWINVPQWAYTTCGSRNSFTAVLWDDGTGVDESSTSDLEGPTDVRRPKGSTTLVQPRQNGSGYIDFSYGVMDILGATNGPFLAGYSAGFQVVTPAEVNLSSFPALIGNGSQAVIYELFNSGSQSTPAFSDWNLRAEGNDPKLSTPVGQLRLNKGRLSFAGAWCVQ